MHNRCETAIEHIEKILRIHDERYDILVSDTSDDGKDLMSIWEKTDKRVKVYRADPATPAITNWKLAFDKADGLFAFHLNDRDTLIEYNLQKFLDFLEGNKEYNGGVCKFIPTLVTPIMCDNKSIALMNVPFFASHTTGIVVNTKGYKQIENRDKIFSLEYGLHPHDIILGRLSEYGKLFIYTDEIWRYASPEFYKKNRSGVLAKEKGFFFEPRQRLFELKQNIHVLNSLSFSEYDVRQKTEQMYKTYLGLATNAYFYVVESEYESEHYGIQREKYGILRKFKFSMNVFEMFDKEFHFSQKERKTFKKWLVKTISIPVLAKFTSKIKNTGIRATLRKLRIRRETKEQAILR